MPRAIWSGTVSFGLVNVPVKAFTASRDHTVHFHQLDKKTGARVRYEKISEKSQDTLDADDIELGYEVGKGEYVTFERDELEKLQPESTRTLEVSDFVDLRQIDPIYYERTYWLAPDGDAAARAYRLLLDVMEDEARVGIGTVVMRNKQYLAAIRPLDGAMAMSTMRFADEVVPRSDINGLPKKSARTDPKERKLAKQIIDALASDWDPSRYHDTYTDELRALIDRKAKGETIIVEEKPEETGKVLDLMAALQASVDAAKHGRRRSVAKTAKKTTKPSTRKTTKQSTKKAAGKRAAPRKRKSA